MQHLKIVSIHQRRILEDGTIDKGIRRSDLKSDRADLSISSKRFGTNSSSMDFQPGSEKSSYIRTT